MLVIGRMEEQKLYIGEDIVVMVVDIKRDQVKLGIQCPDDVVIGRRPPEQWTWEKDKNAERRKANLHEEGHTAA